MVIDISFGNSRSDGVYCEFWVDNRNIKELRHYQNGLLQGNMKKYAHNGDLIYWAEYYKSIILYEIDKHGYSINDQIEGRLMNLKRNINVKVGKIRHIRLWIIESIMCAIYGITLLISIFTLVLLIPVGFEIILFGISTIVI